MPFDPTKPADNSPLSSQEMRDQLNALNDALPEAIANTANNPINVTPLDFTINDPPTLLDVFTIYSKVNELILALRRV